MKLKRRRPSEKKRLCLSYDERLDWLETDDCSKWPGRWLHLCFPFSLSSTFFPHSVAFSLRPLSLPPCLSLSPSFLGFIMAAHQRSASLSTNGTAISTNAFQTYSSCHITVWWKVHVFLQSPQSLFFLLYNRVSVPACCSSCQPYASAVIICSHNMIGNKRLNSCLIEMNLKMLLAMQFVRNHADDKTFLLSLDSLSSFI